MAIPDHLRCLFSATIEEHGGTYVVELPEQEIQLGSIQEDKTYTVALLPSPAAGNADTTNTSSQTKQEEQGPPVEKGEQRTVEIETLGDQGDGIARVERGFVIIVPGTEKGERVSVKITEVGDNLAFAEVIGRVERNGATTR